MEISKLSAGKGKQTEKHYAVFAFTGRKCRVPLFTSRKASEEAGRKIQELADLAAAGATFPADLSRWVETMPGYMRDSLASYGVLSRDAAAGSKPLAEHLKDWRAALSAKGNTAEYVDLKVSRAESIFNACGFTFYGDLSASRLERHLATLRKGNDKSGGISAQTSNFYLQACQQFCRWMMDDRRVKDNPLSHLKALNVRTDRRHDRRALDLDEARRFLAAAESGPTWYHRPRKGVATVVTGKDRAMLYRTAIETGLRQNELRSLTRASFDLEAGGVTIGAKDEKRRKGTTLPLRAELVAELRTYLANKMPTARAFPVPPKDNAIRMLRADLQRAREAWIKEASADAQRAEREQSSFLAYQDERGLFADFHALRHTRGVWLFQYSKATPREAQELMRVCSLSLVDRYSKSFRLTDNSVVERMPGLSSPVVQQAKATGTDGVFMLPPLSLPLSLTGGVWQDSAELPGVLKLCQKKSHDDRGLAKSRGKPRCLTPHGRLASVWNDARRSGRAAECAGFENGASRASTSKRKTAPTHAK